MGDDSSRLSRARHRHLLRVGLLALACLLTSVGGVHAGTTGKIAGRITDAETGEGLIGAAVQVDGSTLGAAADVDGNYFILNVPPGPCTVRVSSLGYTSRVFQGVQVSSDQTALIDAALSPESVMGQEVTVVAERPLIQQDRTFAVAHVGTDEIAALPVISLDQVVEKQAGVVDGHFRGGRSGEVLYLVDGVSVTDAYDNSHGTKVDESSVQELQVISGTFNAEYGQVLSGVVNIATKDGNDDYHATFSSEFGDYVTSRTDRYINIDHYSPLAIQDYRLSFEGPVPRTNNLFFYLNGTYSRDSGWLYGQRRWNLEHKVQPTDTGIILFPEYGDNSYAAMNGNFERYGIGKLSWRPKPNLKLAWSSLHSARNYRDYNHDRKFTPDADLRRYRDGHTDILKYEHTLSKRLFYELAFTEGFNRYQHYLFEDPFDSRYVHPGYTDANPPYTLKFAGTDLSHFQRWTQTHEFLSSVSSQVNNENLVKVGIDAKFYKLFYEDITLVPANPGEIFDPSGEPNYAIFDPAIPPLSSNSHDLYVKNPWELGLYVQDKFELRSLIIQAGLRFDYFDPDGKVLADEKDPNINDPLLIQHNADPLEVRKTYWYKDVDAKSRISPRLGVAYPMSDKGAFHFSYGHFVQRPTFERLFQNPDFELEEGVGLNTVMGNADLKMEETVSYEFGFSQQIAEDVSLETSLYYRDIRNLVATDKIVETYSAGTKYSQYINRAFGEVKGIILSLDRRMSDNVSAFVKYTFQTAEGNASDAQSAYNASRGNNPREPEKQLVPLDWDRRHTLNTSVTYMIPGARGWGATLFGVYGSALPYTPVNQGIRTGFENDGRRPAFVNFDLSAFKKFKLNRKQSLTLTTTILNVFDIANEDRVYADTGRAGYSQDEQTAIEVPEYNTLEELYNNPGFYSRPRMLRVGLEVGW